MRRKTPLLTSDVVHTAHSAMLSGLLVQESIYPVIGSYVCRSSLTCAVCRGAFLQYDNPVQHFVMYGGQFSTDAHATPIAPYTAAISKLP